MISTPTGRTGKDRSATGRFDQRVGRRYGRENAVEEDRGGAELSTIRGGDQFEEALPLALALADTETLMLALAVMKPCSLATQAMEPETAPLMPAVTLPRTLTMFLPCTVATPISLGSSVWIAVMSAASMLASAVIVTVG